MSQKKVVDKKVYLPLVEYHFSSSDLIDFLREAGHSNLLNDAAQLEKILSLAENYADYSKQMYSKKTGVGKNVHRIKARFGEKIVKVPMKFKKEYKYTKLRIGPSTIKEAGLGVFAIDFIPKDASDAYLGVIANKDNVNAYYSWEVKKYDKVTGEPTSDDVLFYIDAEDPIVSNWTRYVNCGPTSKSNNIVMEQLYDKIFYVAKRDIEPGEELFIDYGSGYRRVNLKMKGKY
jgi:hypothetical protein